jgi:hypothetical protein
MTIIKFGLIAEGKTDLYVIENILMGMFGEDYIQVNDLQPTRDETNKDDFAGWQKVFEYCRSEFFAGVLQLNDFVVIQIDTDVSEEEGFDVLKWRGNTEKELSVEQLVGQVKERIIQEIEKDLYVQIKERIIFAIAVDSIECWLLPIVCGNAKQKAEILNCFDRVNRELNKKKSKVFLNKERPSTYETISNAYNKNKFLMKHYTENPSLYIFMKDLQSKNIEISEDE